MARDRSGREIPEVLSRAVTAHQAGDLTAAARMYDEILQRNPGHADALHLSGLVAFQRGRADEALPLIEQAVRIDDAQAMYHANLGRILQDLGRSTEAVRSYACAIDLEPETAVLRSDLAAALIALETYEEALAECERAIALDAGLAEGHLNLGLVLLHTGDYEKAIASLDQAVHLAPGNAFAHFQQGVALQADGRNGGAAECYRRAVEIDPNLAEAHCNLGNILKDEGEFTQAVDEYRAAIAINANLAEAHSNLGVVLHELDNQKGALECFDRALELAPDDAEIHRNRAIVLLSMGRFSEGWRENEWRWKTKHFEILRRKMDVPAWEGGDLSGRRILIRAEQGYGDTIQFMRYLPIVADHGGDIVFECPAELAGLAGGLVGSGNVVADASQVSGIDCHAPLLSLPGILGTDHSSIPADVPYLSAHKTCLDAARRQLPEIGKLRVGIAWRGSAAFKRDRIRSLELGRLRELFETDGVAFVSLQKDNGASDLEESGLARSVSDVTGSWRDFSDSAATVSCLDLVIAPDTAIVHLAGALGKPVWTLLPFVADWRWMADREDSPWYPSMRLFRQQSPGDWAGVVGCVKKELTAF